MGAENTTNTPATKYLDYVGLSKYNEKIKSYIADLDKEVVRRGAVKIVKLETPTEGNLATYVITQDYNYKAKADGAIISYDAYQLLVDAHKANPTTTTDPADLYDPLAKEIGRIDIPKTDLSALETAIGKNEDGNLVSVTSRIKAEAGSADSNVTVLDKYKKNGAEEEYITIEEYNALTEEQKAEYTAVNKTLNLNEAIKDAKDAATAGSVVSVVKQASADEGFAATYYVTQNGAQVGTKINIPKDFLVKSASVKTCETADQPVEGYVVGDKYIDFVVNTVDGSATAQHIYLLVNELVDVYTGSTSDTTHEITVTIDEHNKIQAAIANGTIARAKIDSTFEGQVAAVETALQKKVDGTYETVSDRIKDEAKDGVYKAATEEGGDDTTIGEAIGDIETAINTLVTQTDIDALFA